MTPCDENGWSVQRALDRLLQSLPGNHRCHFQKAHERNFNKEERHLTTCINHINIISNDHFHMKKLKLRGKRDGELHVTMEMADDKSFSLWVRLLTSLQSCHLYMINCENK